MKRLLLGIIGPEQSIDYKVFCQILSEYEMDILDINLGVVFGQQSFGILANAPPEGLLLHLERQLRETAAAQKAQILIQDVTAKDHLRWLEKRGLPHYTLTLMSSGVSARSMGLFIATVAEQGLSVASIERLSGYPLPGKPSLICLEMSLRGVPRDEIKLRHTLLALGQKCGIDVGLQNDDMFRRNRRVVAFDMDATLIEVEVIDELAKLMGSGERVAVITAKAMAGEISFAESLKMRVSLLCGLEVAVLRELATRLPLTSGTEKLLSTLKTLHYQTAIISGGFDIVAEALAQRLGIDYAWGNKLEIQNEKLTGRLIPPIVDEKRKALLLEELAGIAGVDMRQVIAIGDGANDLEMLSRAGLGIAFSSRPAVLRSARHSLTLLGLDALLFLVGVKVPGTSGEL